MIVFEIAQRFGFEMLGIVVLMGGAIQLAAGICGQRCPTDTCFRRENGTVPLGRARGTGPYFRSGAYSLTASSRRKMDQSPSDV